MTAAAALRRVATLGPYFAVDVEPAGEDWLPLRRLVDEPAVVRERVEFVRGALGLRSGQLPADVDPRVAASIHFLGLASRLVAPALAAAAVTGLVPLFEPDDVRWQRVDGGPIPLAVTGATAAPVTDAAEAAGALCTGVLPRIVTPLVEAFVAAAGVSRIVLWGNVASALAGAASMVRRSDEAIAVDPVAIVAEVLALAGPLHGAGRFDVDGRFFVRSSCCLFYRIPNAGKCGDCVLL